MDDLCHLPPAEFSLRMHAQLLRACPDKESEAFINQNIQLATVLGLTYVEGLHFVIQQRAGLN